MPSDQEDQERPRPPMKSWTVRHCIQSACILLSLTGIVLISFSLDHDSTWNSWVDYHFNLNRKNAFHIIRMDEYTAVENQQQWIDLLKREHIQDKLYLVLAIAAALLLVFFALSLSPSDLMGGVVHALCGILLLVAGCVLISSLLAVDANEGKVSSLLDHLEKRASGKPEVNQSSEMSVAVSAEIGESIHSVSCRTADQHTSVVVNNCQLYVIKVLAIADAWLAVVFCLFLTWSFLRYKIAVGPLDREDDVLHISRGDDQEQYEFQVVKPNPVNEERRRREKAREPAPRPERPPHHSRHHRNRRRNSDFYNENWEEAEAQFRRDIGENMGYLPHAPRTQNMS